MKKIIIILIVVLIFGLIINKDEETLLTVNDLEDNDMGSQMIYLTIPSLTTKNITNYFNDDSDIIGIYPFVNPLYQKKLGNMFYSFNSESLNGNIKKFTKYYKQKLINHNFNNDAITIDYTGISILKVKIYMTKEELTNFLKTCKNCEYTLIKN